MCGIAGYSFHRASRVDRTLAAQALLAGIAERGFRTADRWLAATLEAIKRCPCSHGCPSCVQSPKCGNGNEPLDKQGAAALLAAILGDPWG